MADTEEKVFDGRLIKLFRAERSLPNGRRCNLEMIKHPGAALIVPFLSDAELILIRQFRPVIGHYMYEFPAGTIENGESPAVCAAREIEEETGYRADTLVELGAIRPVPGYSTELITVFKATGLHLAQTNFDRDEVIENVVVSPERIKEMFRAGEIPDAKTVCGLAMCGLL